MKKTLLAVLLACAGISAFSQLNMTMTDNIDYAQSTSSLWGWTDPDDSTEYVLVGTQTGLSIVSLADPFNIVEVGFIPDNNSAWREVKAYDHYAYVVTESTNPTPSGVLVVDFSDAPNSFSATHWIPNIPGLGALNKGHSITVDEAGGWLYVNGSNLNAGGCIIADIHTDPANPVYVGHTNATYCHDSYARGSYLYTSDIYGGELSFYDVSDHANPVLVASQPTPGDFTHNSWLNDAGNVTFTTDEVVGAPVTSYDISDLGDIIELDRFYPLAAPGQSISAHNVHVWDDWVITAYYTLGALILDGSNPSNLIEVGNFDTFVGGGGFDGVWGVYPYFPSGLVAATDIDNGLFIFDVNYVRACWLEGTVTSSATGDPIFGADIHIESAQPNEGTTDLDGKYATGQALAGTFDAVFSATGFYPKTISVTLENGILTVLDVQLDPLAYFSLSGQTIKAIGGAPVPGAQVLLQGDQGTFTTTSDASGNFSFSNVGGGDYLLVAGAWGYRHEVAANFVVGTGTPQPVVLTLDRGYQDDFILDFAWTTEDNAQSGEWERGEPIGTLQNGELANPESDVDGDIGDLCYMTGNGGGGPGSDDVDNGSVTLLSPLMNLTTYNDPVLRYNSWFFNVESVNPNPNDMLQVRVSNGADEVVLETVTTSGSVWNPAVEFHLNDFITPTATMQVIFEVTDNAPGHLLEGAVDAFLVEDVSAYPPFTTSATEGCLPFTVEFSDPSDSTQTWEWIFEGGSPATSTDQNPVVTWNTAGTYSVTLLVTTDAGNIYLIERPNFIVVGTEPVAAFNASTSGATVNFTNTSSGGGLTDWNFGDGSTSVAQNPAHTYQQVGTYTVTLTVTNECGTSTYSQDVTVTAVPPTASFGVSASQGCVPFTVEFQDMSAGDPTSWSWSFPGGSPNASTAQNPTVTYASTGTFSVQLVVTNAAGTSQVIQSQFIEVGTVPSVDFTFEVTGGEVVFTNASSNAASYEWTFGDGSTSTAANPTHTYAADGNYEVTLEATNECGFGVSTQVVAIDLTGTTDLDEAGYSLAASPNPFAGDVLVKYELKQAFAEASLLVFNVLGKQVASLPLAAASGSVALGGHFGQPGVYFLQLTVDGKAGKALRVVKI